MPGVEVHYGGPDQPRLRAVRDLTTGGRGLLIVDRLADEWGVADGGDGTTVWARLGWPAGHRRLSRHRLGSRELTASA